MTPIIILLLFIASAYAATLMIPCTALAVTWTPLVASTDFDGIRSDVLVACGGILAVLLIIVAVGLLVKILGR